MDPLFVWYLTVISIPIIAASNVTSDQHFTFNQSGFHLEHHIYCDTGVNCYIACLGDDICHSLVNTDQGSLQFLTIHAENANNLYLSCVGEESCARMSVIPPTNGNVHIHCNKNTINGLGACIWMKLYANNTNNITIHCEQIKDCYAIHIEVHRANYVNISFASPQSGSMAYLSIDHIHDSLNLICSGTESCRNADVFCSQGAQCNVRCISESSCGAMTFYIPSTTYNSLNISCTDYQNHLHCFWLNDTQIFPTLYQADIQCQDTHESSPLIYNIYNDQLSCDDSCCPFEVQELQFSMLYCGDTNGTCTIDCASILCDGKIIDAHNMSGLNVICNASEDTYSTCDGLQIMCPQHGKCVIECDIHLGCKDLKVQYDSDAVSDGNVIVICSNDDVCNNINITAPNAYAVTVHASAHRSLVNGEIHVENVHKFEMFCYNKYGEYYAFKACANNMLYVSDDVDNYVNITCNGKACGNMHFYVLNEWRAANNMNLNIVSECECNERHVYWRDCTDLIGIFCGQHGDIQYAEFEEVEYGNCSDLCGCHNLVENIKNNYVETDDCEHVLEDYHIIIQSSAVTIVTSVEAGMVEDATVIGIIITVIILCGLIVGLRYFQLRKLRKQIHGAHLRQLHSVADDEDDIY